MGAAGFFLGLTSKSPSSSEWLWIASDSSALAAAFFCCLLGLAAASWFWVREGGTAGWRVRESAAKARATTQRSERTQRLDSGPIGCGQQAAPAGRGAMLAEPRCGRGEGAVWNTCNNNNKLLLTLGRCGYCGGDTPGLVRSMGAPAPDSGTWGVASHTHTRARTHTHRNRNAADRRLSVSDPQTQARRSTRTRTYVRPRRWRTACAQSVHASGVRVRASAHVCVCVCQWLCACVVAAQACGCVYPGGVCSTARWDADLRANARPLCATVPIYVCCLPLCLRLGVDKRTSHLRDDRDHQREFIDEL